MEVSIVYMLLKIYLHERNEGVTLLLFQLDEGKFGGD